jgi:PEP-CTERM motif
VRPPNGGSAAMNSIHRSIFARALMTGAASLVLMFGTAGVRAEIVTAQGADGANAVDGDPDVPAGEGESVTASAGSMQPVTAPSNSAFATGGNGGSGGNDLGNGVGASGGRAGATAATRVISGSAKADATAIGGNGGNIGPGGFQNDGYGGFASANSTAVTTGSGDASSSANATGGATGFGDFGFADGANAVADAAAAGDGKAAAAAFATGGICNTVCAPMNGANATSNAETVNGAMADARSIAISGGSPNNNAENAPGQASSTAKTSFASVSVQSSALSKPGLVDFGGVSGGVAATTDAIAQGGSGQAFVNPGQTAYAFSTALPDKAYATSLIDGASHIASTLLGPRDVLFGTAILGANYASDGAGESGSYSASSTFDFGYRGDLLVGLIDDQVSGFAGGVGFQSMEFTIEANGVEILDATFRSLAIAESFFHDDVIDLGSDFGPNIDLTFGYTLVADGSGGFGFDFAVGGAVPEPSTWAMMALGFAGLGFLGWRGSRKTAARAA